jgi:hypothetical protein
MGWVLGVLVLIGVLCCTEELGELREILGGRLSDHEDTVAEEVQAEVDEVLVEKSAAGRGRKR